MRWPGVQIHAPQKSLDNGFRHPVCCIYVLWHIYMSETPEQVREWFHTAILKLWPVATGSLSLRRSPCIRTNCPVCQRGEGHASYALYGRRKGKRFCIYIPDELVPDIQ